MYMYQNKLLILVFLIAGYSGYLEAREESVNAPATEDTRSNDSNENKVQPEKNATNQNNQTASQNKPTRKTSTQNKQTISITNQDNQEDRQNKKECVFKGVMSDEDYYVCHIKPYTKTVHFRDAPMK